MPNHIKPKESKAARQAFLRGELDEKGLVEVTKKYYPSAGACPFRHISFFFIQLQLHSFRSWPRKY
jgi:hypothetical protein